MTGIAHASQGSFSDVVQQLEDALATEEKGAPHAGAAAVAGSSCSMGSSSGSSNGSSSTTLGASSSSNLAAMAGSRACSPAQLQQASNSNGHLNGHYQQHQLQQQQQQAAYLSGLAGSCPGLLGSTSGSSSSGNLAGLGLPLCSTGTGSTPLNIAGSGQSLFSSGHLDNSQGHGFDLAAAVAGGSPLLMGSLGGLQGGLGQAGVTNHGAGSAPGTLSGVFGAYGGYNMGFNSASPGGQGLLQGYEAAAAAAAYHYGSAGNLQHLEEAMGRRLL